jgi:hypothetical protein
MSSEDKLKKALEALEQMSDEDYLKLLKECTGRDQIVDINKYDDILKDNNEKNRNCT